MTAPASTVDADRPLREAAALLVDRGVNRLPETDNGRLVGIVIRAEFVPAYLRRDDETLRTIRENVIRRTMWLDPDDLRVEVREGMERIAGTVGRRSTATIFETFIGVLDGVKGVASLSWGFDDSALEPAEPDEPEPGTASLTARERPRPLYGLSVGQRFSISGPYRSGQEGHRMGAGQLPSRRPGASRPCESVHRALAAAAADAGYCA